MKRYTVVGATVSLALFSSAALAAPNIVNTTQKGSLLIFPEIDAYNSDTNTIIRITNDNTGRIDVKCYYGEFTNDIYNKPTRDFQFTLTKNQPAYWEVRDGEGTITAPDFPDFDPNTDRGRAGQLICWAVSKGGGTQVKWNHLSGTATIVDMDENKSYSYNAYQFYARGAKNKQQVGSKAGVLELDGTAAGGGYDKCGKYIIGHFSPDNAQFDLRDELEINDNYLSISSCTQDLSPVGKANPIPLGCTPGNCGQTIVFDVWNEDEVKFTGTREKADSWWRIELDSRSGGDRYSGVDVNQDNFEFRQLQTNSGYFRAQSEEGFGLLGVLVTVFQNNDDDDDELRSAVTVNHAGNRVGKIIWRTQDDEPPEKM